MLFDGDLTHGTVSKQSQKKTNPSHVIHSFLLVTGILEVYSEMTLDSEMELVAL